MHHEPEAKSKKRKCTKEQGELGSALPVTQPPPPICIPTGGNGVSSHGTYSEGAAESAHALMPAGAEAMGATIAGASAQVLQSSAGTNLAHSAHAHMCAAGEAMGGVGGVVAENTAGVGYLPAQATSGQTQGAAVCAEDGDKEAAFSCVQQFMTEENLEKLRTVHLMMYQHVQLLQQHIKELYEQIEPEVPLSLGNCVLPSLKPHPDLLAASQFDPLLLFPRRKSS